MLKALMIMSLLAMSSFALSPQEFMQQQVDGFKSFKKTKEDEFSRYKKEQNKAFKDYKQELSAIWTDPRLSSKKAWVSYTKNMRTRADVDFEKETITIETVASSKKDANKKLNTALARAVTIDTKTLHATDPLQKRLNKLKVPKNIVIDEIIPEPILSTVVFENKPTKKSIKSYLKEKIIYDEIKIKESKIKNSKVYSVKIDLPKDTMLKRSKIYYKEVKKQASLQKLPVSLVFAIMHSESNFNPRARSHVPAYGLMQIVPSTAGIDAYNYLYNKKKLVSGTYLYNSRNNITMGSAYLHILYYKYLRKIKNEETRLYCTIAAYNTGAGNVAWAFTNTLNVNKAVNIINNMESQEVYTKLLNSLRFKETKQYLKKVRRRMKAYHKIYGS